MTAGNINIKTSAGSIELKGLNINIKGDVGVTVEAPFVKVGKNAPMGGAITGLPGTAPSHMDYVTGSPLKGSMTVGIA